MTVHMDNADNHGIYDVNTIANYDRTSFPSSTRRFHRNDMHLGGSIMYPPQINLFPQGVTDDLVPQLAQIDGIARDLEIAIEIHGALLRNA